MGCSCSSEAEEVTDPRLRARRRDLGMESQTASVRDHRPQSAQTSSAGGDNVDDEARRLAQEEADFIIAQIMFEEQLMILERQQRLAQRQAAQEPVITGLPSEQLDAAGKVLVFDSLKMKKMYAVHMPGHVTTGSTSLSFNNATTTDNQSLPASPISPAAPNFSFDPSDAHAECALCMEELAEGVELRSLYCGHIFHRECVDDWLRRKRVCPMCQQDVTVVAAGSRKQQAVPSVRTTAPAQSNNNSDTAAAAAEAEEGAQELAAALALSVLIVQHDHTHHHHHPPSSQEEEANSAEPLAGGDSPQQRNRNATDASISEANAAVAISMSNVVVALVVPDNNTNSSSASVRPGDSVTTSSETTGDATLPSMDHDGNHVVMGTVIEQPAPSSGTPGGEGAIDHESVDVATSTPPPPAPLLVDPNPLHDAPASPAVQPVADATEAPAPA